MSKEDSVFYKISKISSSAGTLTAMGQNYSNYMNNDMRDEVIGLMFPIIEQESYHDVQLVFPVNKVLEPDPKKIREYFKKELLNQSTRPSGNYDYGNVKTLIEDTFKTFNKKLYTALLPFYKILDNSPSLFKSLTDESSYERKRTLKKVDKHHRIKNIFWGVSDVEKLLDELPHLTSFLKLAVRILKAEQTVAIILKEANQTLEQDEKEIYKISNSSTFDLKDDPKFNFAGIPYERFINLKIHLLLNKAEILKNEDLRKYVSSLMARIVNWCSTTPTNIEQLPYYDIMNCNRLQAVIGKYLAHCFKIFSIEESLKVIDDKLFDIQGKILDLLNIMNVKSAIKKFSKNPQLTPQNVADCVKSSSMNYLTEINDYLNTSKITIKSLGLKDSNFFQAFNKVLNELSLIDLGTGKINFLVNGVNFSNNDFYSKQNMDSASSIDNLSALIRFFFILHSFDLKYHEVLSDLKLKFSDFKIIDNKVEFTQNNDNDWDKNNHKFKVTNTTTKEIGFADFKNISFSFGEMPSFGAKKGSLTFGVNENFSRLFQNAPENINRILYLQSVLLRINEWGA
ncbi:MAG: hypothetical protein WC936_01375 [Candidatus Nanoarchaeia archaeon]|jgi:hypothetical protein